MVKKTLIGLMAASAATLALSAPASAADEGGWSLTSKVEPGGRINADVYTGLGHSACTPTGPVTSAGFTAPIKMVGMGNWGHMGGSTTAIKRPGKYTASYPCSDGRSPTLTFTILGTPPPDPTTKPKPPATQPKPSKPAKPAKPQVAAKPAGAPQTGDGSLS
ncbi:MULTISPECIES: hypothetical protein [Amycolatopsis]|uniref:Uncharacterized protein n=1 Tax=Amycolatopsis bullii TaxID=941987 RepID=A0ABQ3KHL6_9PSEU|nr:hypothetical protein [Amycolatopsis bullii]GHG25235.1 hypothetical protein GCM10017567_50640 [Amycolatopsis bullii]